MKNLLLYAREDKKFDRETSRLVNVQIDNSLSMGWKPEDIILCTNFPHEYNGVKAHEIPDVSYKPDRTNKIPHILHLFETGIIEKGQTYWYHDFDAYQDQPFNLLLEQDLALTGYGYKPEWNCGSFFFKHEAKDIFEVWNSRIVPGARVDERAITEMTQKGVLSGDRYAELNLTYNFGQRLVEMPEVYDRVEKPIKVHHFHPYYRYVGSPHQNIETFFYGKNRLGIPLISDRLKNIFHDHGIK